MKKNLLLLLLAMFAMVLAVACSDSGSDDETDGDTHVDGDTTPDGDDTPDGDTTPDGDDTPDGDTDGDTSNVCTSSADCEDGKYCKNFECIAPECEAAADCADLYGAGCWTCDADNPICALETCAKSADCSCAKTACVGGVCLAVSDCDTSITTLSVVPTTGLIRQDGTIQLNVTALNANGAKVELPADSYPFTVTSDDATKVEVGANGLLTGKTTSGTATITVKLTCRDTVTATASFTNFATVTAGSRVVVYDEATGALIDGANVTLNDTKVVTAGGGIAEFAAIDCATVGCTMHVIKDGDSSAKGGYTYVSAFGLKTNDIVVPISKNIDDSVACGVKGKQDQTKIPAAVKGEGDLFLGFTSFSIPGNLADLNFESLIGAMLNTHVVLGTVLDDTFPLPGGLEGYLSDEPLKDGFQASAVPGKKGTLWGIGGFAELAELIELAGPAISGGTENLDIGSILAAVMPIFESFYHGIKTYKDPFTGIAKVVDTNDINGNDDKNELVPDYANFATVSDFAVSQAWSQDANLTFKDLPNTPGGQSDAVITLVGAMQTGVGFIPLGLNAALDKLNKDDTANGKVGASNDGKIVAKFAPQHSGVSGYKYAVLSIALPLGSLVGDLLKEDEQSIDLIGLVSLSDGAPTNVTMPDFLTFGDSTKKPAWNATTHTMTGSASGASFHRALFAKKNATDKETRYWHVYWAGDATGFQLPDLTTLGVTDDRTVDYESTSMVQAIKTNGVTYDQLFAFDDKNIDQLNDFMEAFAMHILN